MPTVSPQHDHQYISRPCRWAGLQHGLLTLFFLLFSLGTLDAIAAQVVITPQARCLDLTTCYAQADSLMMVLSPQGAPPALEHLRKYILDDKAVG